MSMACEMQVCSQILHLALKKKIQNCYASIALKQIIYHTVSLGLTSSPSLVSNRQAELTHYLPRPVGFLNRCSAIFIITADKHENRVGKKGKGEKNLIVLLTKNFPVLENSEVE